MYDYGDLHPDTEIGAQGIKHICDALVHPNGPNNLTSLRLNSESFTLDRPYHLAHLSLVANIGDEGGQYIYECLNHPDGPKHLTSIDLMSKCTLRCRQTAHRWLML